MKSFMSQENENISISGFIVTIIKALHIGMWLPHILTIISLHFDGLGRPIHDQVVLVPSPNHPGGLLLYCTSLGSAAFQMVLHCGSRSDGSFLEPWKSLHRVLQMGVDTHCCTPLSLIWIHHSGPAAPDNFIIATPQYVFLVSLPKDGLWKHFLSRPSTETISDNASVNSRWIKWKAIEGISQILHQVLFLLFLKDIAKFLADSISAPKRWFTKSSFNACQIVLSLAFFIDSAQEMGTNWVIFVTGCW